MSTNKTKLKFSISLSAQFPRHEQKENMHEKWVYQRNKTKFFHFTINPISQARREKKMNEKKIMGLPTKQNKSLLLHYEPTFPGVKTKKNVHEKKQKQIKNGSTNERKKESSTSQST